ncbi:anther-specific proline-rich protein APG-like [Papio anubis]|uniref:anther-specific proline-rich protein APG-like n=1 Tax=Papio anubis TaxID=9555 RepID=UPI0004F1EB6E|nr:anther-specific proline-rich protein APG-like [Papio anubis]
MGGKPNGYCRVTRSLDRGGNHCQAGFLSPQPGRRTAWRPPSNPAVPLFSPALPLLSALAHPSCPLRPPTSPRPRLPPTPELLSAPSATHTMSCPLRLLAPSALGHPTRSCPLSPPHLPVPKAAPHPELLPDYPAPRTLAAPHP